MAIREEILEKKYPFTTDTQEYIMAVDPMLEDKESKGYTRKMKDPEGEKSGEVMMSLEGVKMQLHPSLDLSLPYDRAVLIELLRFVAVKDGCAIVLPDSKDTQVVDNLVDMIYHPMEGGKEEINLIRIVETTLPNDGDEELVKWINGDRDPREIFDKFDVDNSGEIDR